MLNRKRLCLNRSEFRMRNARRNSKRRKLAKLRPSASVWRKLRGSVRSASLHRELKSEQKKI